MRSANARGRGARSGYRPCSYPRLGSGVSLATAPPTPAPVVPFQDAGFKLTMAQSPRHARLHCGLHFANFYLFFLPNKAQLLLCSIGEAGATLQSQTPFGKALLPVPRPPPPPLRVLVYEFVSFLPLPKFLLCVFTPTPQTHV